VSTLSPARKVAASLLGECRRRNGRIRDIARDSSAAAALSPQDRALAYRLALGVTSACALLDELVDAHVRRPSSLEPRVRDALRMATFELCYLDTPSAAAVSQGVELVRSVAPRAAGLANAVLRRVSAQDAPRVAQARTRVAEGGSEVDDLALVSGLARWLVSRVHEERGADFARGLCLAQLEPAPVFVAANTLANDADALEGMLRERGMAPERLVGLPGSFVLGDSSPLATSGLMEHVALVAADVSAQLVCRIAAPEAPSALLEVGQGRGTKSVLLAAASGCVHPSRVVGVDSVPYKVRVSRRRMREAGLDGVVSCLELDARELAGEGLPDGLGERFATVLVDAPCSGSGTMRRHPEIASALDEADVHGLSALQLEILSAASARVAAGGTLVYSTCSVLREEDEDVARAFLASEAGRAFELEPVADAPACAANEQLRDLVLSHQTAGGHLLTMPVVGGGDGHFCVRLVRRA
jgi:16S rRNA (cytosine967-C5)-methyltransferase